MIDTESAESSSERKKKKYPSNSFREKMDLKELESTDTKVNKDKREAYYLTTPELIFKENSELADLFNVSERTIRKDRAFMRGILAEEAEAIDLAGELFAVYRTITSRMDRAIEQGEFKKVRALKSRWQITRDFTSYMLPIQIDRITKELRETKQRIQPSAN